jgi:hypothetical protein
MFGPDGFTDPMRLQLGATSTNTCCELQGQNRPWCPEDPGTIFDA